MSAPRSALETGPIIVGFKPEVHPVLIDVARNAALAFDCEVIFTYVEMNNAMVELETASLEYVDALPSEDNDDLAAMTKRLAETLTLALNGSAARWSLRVVAGDPATALSRLGAELGARLYIVGTRGPGPLNRLEEILTGAVGRTLAMGQDRPVMIVPMGRRQGRRLVAVRYDE
jgi:nucleotide-binding universal stress UspA family protein